MKMEIKRHESGSRLSTAVEYGGIIYFSGLVGKGDTMTEQAKSILTRFEELFHKYGTDKEHMLTAAVFLSDISQKPDFDAVWCSWIIEGSAPTRYCVEAGLGTGVLAEVVITAVKK